MKRVALIGLVVVALAGCGGKGGTPQQAASGGGSGKTVQIKETEFKLAPAKVTIAAPGTVTFEATNAGKIDFNDPPVARAIYISSRTPQAP